MRIRAWGVLLLVVLTGLVLHGQTKPPPSGGGGIPLPAPVRIQAGEITVDIRGNEGTEDLASGTLANLFKQMPGRRLNGVDKLFHIAYSTTSLVLRGMNLEHITKCSDTPNNYYTPRLMHMAPVRVDAATVEMSGFDSRWHARIYQRYQAVAPHAIDWHFEIAFDDVSLIEPCPYVAVMFANYAPFTLDPKLYFYGQASPGAPETWLGVRQPYPGGFWREPAAVALPVDPANPTPTYSATYKDNLKSVEWPRVTGRFYCGQQTATNTIWQWMWPDSIVGEQEFRPGQFLWNVKTDANGNSSGTPAWDGQLVIYHPQPGQVYTLDTRTSVRPRLATGSFEAECAAEDAVWRVQ